MIKFKKGDIVKMNRLWHGIVQDVFENDQQEQMLVVWLVKNVFKNQKPEIHPASFFEPSTIAEMSGEIYVVMDRVQSELERMLYIANLSLSDRGE